MVIGFVERNASQLRDITNQSTNQSEGFASMRDSSPGPLRKAVEAPSFHHSDSVVDILPRLGSEADGRLKEGSPDPGVPRVDSWNLPCADHGMRVTFQVTGGGGPAQPNPLALLLHAGGIFRWDCECRLPPLWGGCGRSVAASAFTNSIRFQNTACG